MLLTSFSVCKHYSHRDNMPTVQFSVGSWYQQPMNLEEFLTVKRCSRIITELKPQQPSGDNPVLIMLSMHNVRQWIAFDK